MEGYDGASTRVGYHGTSREYAASIISGGFDRSDASKMLGAGVYWSDDVAKAKAYGPVLLKLEVRPGRVKKIDRQNHPLQKTWQAEYDTAWVPSKCGMVPSGLSENCTYDPARLKVVEVSTDGGTTWRRPHAAFSDARVDDDELRRRHGVGTVYAAFAHVPTRKAVTGGARFGSGVQWDLNPNSPGFGTGWY